MGCGCLILAWVAPVDATKGPQDVANTAHNFSVTGSNPQFSAAYEDEICIYCHTPHGGSLDGPLWNRGTLGIDGDLKGPAYFTHYNSATLSSGAKVGVNRDLGSESLLCMGCHDGTIAVNRVMNVSNRTTPDGTEPDAIITGASYVEQFVMESSFTEPGPLIGASAESMAVADYSGHLEDDHPVSFLYTDSYTQKSSSLHLIGDVRAKGLRFFPLGGAGARLECSTCHDPHVDYNTASQYTPFLVTSNEASAMCLACHIK